MSYSSERFRYLLWKNLIAERRSWIRTPLEVLIIVLSFIIIKIDPTENDIYRWKTAEKIDFYPPEDYDNLIILKDLLNLKRPNLPLTLSYSPKTNMTTQIIEDACKSLNLRTPIGFKTNFEMEAYFDKRIILGGIAFENMEDEDLKNFSISIRFPSSFRTISTSDAKNKLWITRCNGFLLQTENHVKQETIDLYIREGFLQVQHAIFLAWLKTIGAITTPTPDNVAAAEAPVKIEMRAMHHDSGVDLCNYASSSNLNSLLYYFCFLFPCWNLLHRYGTERESDIMTNQRKYGFCYWHHWLAHFCISFVHFAVLNLIIVIILKINFSDNHLRPYSNTSGFVLMGFLSLYSIALIVFAMTTTSMLIRATNVKLLGLFMWVVSYSIFAIVLEPSRGLSMKWLVFTVILFFNNSFSTTMRRLSLLDLEELPDHVENLYIALFINIILQLVLMWHFQHLRPGQYVRPGPYNFLMCRTIFNKCFKKKDSKKTITIVERPPSWHNFENPPLESENVVTVKNVCTQFDRSKRSHQLQKISMKLFRGEITAILGHKSSGKTTLLCILMGNMQPTVGTVTYKDINVHTEWKEARKYMDCVMSNNCLFEMLTVMEMLKYVIYLKRSDLYEEYLKLELKKWLSYLKTAIPKSNTLVKNLNYDQKRLLCLTCALTCGTEVVIMDEPAQYMTFRSRQIFWQITQLEKPNRAIIVALNSIDEAEMIADRLGILTNGVLNAYGTIFFFKSKYGVGYDLIVLIQPDANVEQITRVVSKYFPKILPENQIGDQVFYKLPSQRSNTFQRLLLELEREEKALKIRHLKIIGSELGEVFMTFGMHKYKQRLSEDVSKRFKGITMRRRDLIKQQIQAMLFKKIVHQAPNIIPIVMIFATLFMIIIMSKLSYVLLIPPVSHQPIYLGVKDALTKTNMASDTKLGACKSIIVEKVFPGPLFNKTNAMSRFIEDGSLICSQKSYEDFVKGTSHSVEKYGGVEMLSENSLIGYFNLRIFHNAPMVLNLAHNMYLRNNPDYSDYFTELANDPMKIPLALKINLLDNQLSHLVMPIVLGFVMPLTISTFIIEIVSERRNHILMLYRISGMHKGVYWAVSLLWDLFTFIAYAIIIIVVLSFLTIEGFSFPSKMVLLVILIFYGFSGILLTYLISMIFHRSTSTSFLIAVNIHTLTGITLYILYWDVFISSDYVMLLGMLSPNFALMEGISRVYIETKQESYCRVKCEGIGGCSDEILCDLIPQCCFDTYFKWEEPGVMPCLAALTASGGVFMLIIFLIELWQIENKFPYSHKLKKMRSMCYPYDDRAVVAVKKRIAEAEMRTCRQALLVVDQVEESMPKGAKDLHTVSFDLQRGRCLAIYGPRRSGKSHLIRQLIGQDGFSFGDIYVKGIELKYETQKAYAYMGYCPQDKGLHGSFTCREMMHVMAMIRGVPKDEISDIIKELSAALDMRTVMNQQIKTLTQEHKRKMNIALAVLVSNDVIILDQPTTGLNALTRREIWNVLRFARFCGKVVVITTRCSMECEALADEVLIMERGEMLAYGSIQNIRTRFSRGFYLEVKLYRDGNTAEEAKENLLKDVENLKRFVTFLHEESELKSQIGGMLKFYCPVKNIIYSTLFGAMEKNRRRLNISSYTISQGSMEDIVLNLLDTRLHRSRFL